MSDPMSLDGLCARLRRDDPDLINVDLTPRRYHGHGERIGQALLQNSKVTNVQFAMEGLVDENDVFHAERYPLLQYIRTNMTVRDICLFSVNPPPRQHGVREIERLRGLVLDAIAQNPHILAFDCFPRVPIEPMAQLLTRTISLTHLSFSAVHSIAHDSLTLQRFAEALSMNRTLRQLILVELSKDDSVMDAFLLPLASHPTVEILGMNFLECKHIPSSLARLLHASTTKIGMLLLRSASFDGPSWSVLCDALKGSLSIFLLRLVSCSIAVPPASILQLVRENSSLQDVNLGNLLDDAHHSKLMAYCQRNMRLEGLLSLEFVDEHTGSAVDKSAEIGGLSLLPHLLAAAQQVPRNAHNSILISLLAMPSDAIGIKPTEKRTIAVAI
jgi:hypothetical protein